MATIEAIRRVTVQGRTQGVAQATRELNDLASAQGKVSVSAEKSSRATMSVERALERQRMALDTNYRAMRQFEKAQQDLDRARAQGMFGGARGEAEFSKLTLANFSRYEAATKGVGEASTKMAGQVGLARHEMINLSRQAQDVFVSLQGGQSPLTVLVQQGSQIGDIFGSTQGTMRGFAGQLAGIFTASRLVGLGLVGIAAGAMVAVASLKNFAVQLDDVSRATGIAINDMARLQAVASFKGIDSGDFAEAMTRFSTQVYQARNNMGPLADLMRANGVYARNTGDAFDRVADLMMRARDDQQRLSILQQVGLPATMQWVRLLSQGSDALNRSKIEAVGISDNMAEVTRKAREFDENWNRAWTNLSLSIKAATADLTEYYQWLKLVAMLTNPIGAVAAVVQSARGATPAQQINARFPRADERFRPFTPGAAGGAAGGTTVDPAAVKNENSLLQQRLGLLGELATAEQRIAGMRSQINVARLDGVRISRQEEDAIIRLVRLQTEQSKLSQQVQFGIFDANRQRETAALQIQTLVDEKIIRTTEQHAAAWAVVEKRIREAGDAAAVARSPFEQLTRTVLDSSNSMRQIDIAATSSLNNVENALVDMATGAKTMQDAFRDLVNSVLKDLMRLVIRQGITAPLGNMLLSGLGGGSSGFGGVTPALGALYHTGGVVGASGMPGRYVHPAYFDDAPRFLRGGIAGLGPDEVPIIAHRNEEVLRRDDPRHRFNGGGASAPQVNIHNYGAAEVEARPSEDGMGIDVFVKPIENALAGRMTRGHGSLSKAATPNARVRRG